MAIPAFNPTTSVQEGKQWHPFHFQPFASGAPTLWVCPNLPSGLEIDADTGLISGTPEISGTFVLGVIASNVDGASDPLVVTIGIEPSAASVTRPGTEVKWDLASGKVTVTGGEDGKLFVKVGKDLLIWLYTTKGETVVDVAAAALSFSFREFDPEVNLSVSTAWKKFGSGTGAYFGIYARVTGAAAEGAVSNYEADAETKFEGWGEFQLSETNPLEDLGPETLLYASQNFPVVAATAQQ